MTLQNCCHEWRHTVVWPCGVDCLSRRMAAFFPFLSRFCLFFVLSGVCEGTLPQFHMHAAQAYEIAAFFLLFSRSIAFKNALF